LDIGIAQNRLSTHFLVYLFPKSSDRLPSWFLSWLIIEKAQTQRRGLPLDAILLPLILLYRRRCD
jgi:hypothetical protein